MIAVVNQGYNRPHRIIFTPWLSECLRHKYDHVTIQRSVFIFWMKRWLIYQNGKMFSNAKLLGKQPFYNTEIPVLLKGEKNFLYDFFTAKSKLNPTNHREEAV